jgi:hypothetical protein
MPGFDAAAISELEIDGWTKWCALWSFQIGNYHSEKTKDPRVQIPTTNLAPLLE